MRRVLCLCLMLVMILPAAAHAETPAVALNVGKSCVLVGQDGSELVPAGLYANIDLLSEQAPYFYAAYELGGEEPEHVKLLDAAGKPLTDFKYEYLTMMGDRICFEQEGLFGVMNQAFEVVVPPSYTSIVDNGDGGFLALTTDPYDERPDGVYYIDPAGAETATGIRVLYGLTEFTNGLMPVLSADTGRTGYLNPRGEWAIPAQFSYAGPFNGAIADAAIDSGAGLIDTSGNWLITPKYETLTLSGPKAMIVAQIDGTKIALIDPVTYGVVREFTGSDIYYSAGADSRLITVYMGDKLLLVDEKGDTVLESTGVDSSIESDDARVILREGSWGDKNAYLCDLTGKRLAGPYQDIWRVSADGETPYYAFASFETQTEKLEGSDYAYLNEVPDSRRTGLMDENGAVLWPEGDYSELYSPADGLFVVQTPGKAGVIKADGTWLRSYDVAADDEG